MPQERLYRTEAIILRRADLGEADRLLTIFTPARGKLRVVAKGARKPASRKSGHVELFTRSTLLIAKARNLDIVSQAETVEAYRALREDLLRSTYAHYIVELLDRFTGDEEEGAELYDLLADTLSRLCEAENPALLARFYELRLLTLAGYQPRLFDCARCGKPLREIESESPPYGFDCGQGGVLCDECAPQIQRCAAAFACRAQSAASRARAWNGLRSRRSSCARSSRAKSNRPCSGISLTSWSAI